MNAERIQPRRVAVIGGGISGLAAAHRLVELDATLDVRLFEAGERLGGVIHTERYEGFLIEHSADMFITNVPWALDLCRRVGLEDQLIETSADHRRSFIVHRGRLYPVPEGFTLMSPVRIWPMLTTPLLSLRGKLRLAWEYFTPARRDGQDESLASFATRRLGREAYDRLVQPLIGGIYTADPQRLSIMATMPQYVAMERKHGSLIRGVRQAAKNSQAEQTASGARYGLFVTPRDGLSSLVNAVAARLPADCVRLNTAIESLSLRADGKWHVNIPGNRAAEVFDSVIVATGASRTARLLAGTAPQLSGELAKIPHASTALVIVGYRRQQVAHPLDGFGFVVPIVEQRRILACSFSSIKFAGRAPADSVLLRVFVGGACQADLLKLSDDEIKRLVGDELNQLIGARGEPLFCKVIRWHDAMPQYHVGHLELVERIEQHAAALPNFQLAGNAYRGVGIPHCVRSGEQAAECIRNYK